MITMGAHVWLASEHTDNSIYTQCFRKNHVEELKVLHKHKLIFAFEIAKIPEDF
jgi:hypothetical protein